MNYSLASILAIGAFITYYHGGLVNGINKTGYEYLGMGLLPDT